MTDEEKAEQYVKENGKVYYHSNGEPMFTREEDLKFAFLAGLKAQPKWHKAADGDLPNTEREVLVFMWDSYYIGYYKQYDGEDRSWHFEDFDEESEQVIAWCEIPKYTDKE